MGHSCDKFGLTEIHSSSGRHVSNTTRETGSRPIRTHQPTALHGVPSLINPLFPPIEPQTVPSALPLSHNTPDTERWRSARDMFVQYDISRPSGWLSDISLSGDGNASPRRYCRYCHVCSTPTWAPAHCSSCGHRLCERCACEEPGGIPQVHANFSHHPSPTIARDRAQRISVSRPDLESIRRYHQEVITSLPTLASPNQGRKDKQHSRSFNLRTDSSWRNANEEHGEDTAFSQVSAPAIRDHLHISGQPSKQMQSRLTRPIKENPFLLNDRKDKGQETDKEMNRTACGDPMCRATHTGHFPFRHSTSCSKRGSEQSRRGLDLSSASDKTLQTRATRESNSDTNLPPAQVDDEIHRHHSAGFHSYHHIAEHLSSAVGHNAYDLLKERNVKRIQTTPSKTSIKSSPHLEPLTKARPITQVDPFQWTQDIVLPGHPGRPGSSRQQNRPATKALDRLSHENSNRKTTHAARDTDSIETTLRSNQTEVRDDSTLSWRDNDPPKLRLASTPPWLRNPSKEAADATAPLHHISTKNHKLHEHDHGYLSNVIVDGERGHTTNSSTIPAHEPNMRTKSNPSRNSSGPNRESSQATSLPTTLHMMQHQGIQSRPNLRHDHLRSSSKYEAKHQEEHHLPSKRMRDSSSLALEVFESLHATPEIQITPAFTKRNQLATPISVSAQRKIFEPSEDHTDTASSAKKTSHIRTTHSQQAQHEVASSAGQSGQSRSLIER
ncbi:hypothetical protein F5B18DRAFT_338629 [Nemania serpens]|nr:hypothetical protein F5B18DRAFT_338629 [Nemania serpens]